MNGDESDPMLGSEEDRQAYFQKITGMIEQDVEERRAQRLAAFKGTRDSPAVVIGEVGTSDSLVRSLR
jgi:hypothetical protein